MFSPGDRVQAVNLGEVTHKGKVYTGNVRPVLDPGRVYTVSTEMPTGMITLKETDGMFFPERFRLAAVPLDPLARDLINEYQEATQ